MSHTSVIYSNRPDKGHKMFPQLGEVEVLP